MRHKRTITARSPHFKKYSYVGDTFYRLKNKYGIKIKCKSDYYLALRFLTSRIDRRKWPWILGNRYLTLPD